MSGGSKSQRELDLHIAVSGTDAEEPRRMTLPEYALPLHRIREYFGYAPKTHGLELGTNVFIRPVVENRRQTVDRSTVLKDSLLLRQAHPIDHLGKSRLDVGRIRIYSRRHRRIQAKSYHLPHRP